MTSNTWEELARSIANLQNLLIEGVKITSNALERIKQNEQTGEALRGAPRHHPDPHPAAAQDAAREAVGGDRVRPAGAHAPGPRRVRHAPGRAPRDDGQGA